MPIKVTLQSGARGVALSSPPKTHISLLNQPSSVSILARGTNIAQIGLCKQGPPGPSLDQTFETLNKNLKSRPATFNWAGGLLVSVDYDLGGGLSITKTLNYSGSQLDSIVLSGDTPGGISLTKSLTWVDGNLTEVEYS